MNKLMFALGRGLRGAKQAYEVAALPPDPALSARDVTPPRAPEPPAQAKPQAPAPPHAPRALVLGSRPLVMGVLNVTPDSFSDGGDHLDPDAALAHGLRLLEDGADVIDIGAESTRPRHDKVDADEEMRRALPALRLLRAATDAPISIDTQKAAVAEAALNAGASILNDIWGFQRDARLASLAAERGVSVVLMHNRDAEDASIDIVEDVRAFLARSIEIALRAGVAEDKIIIDPGFGFGKTYAQGLTLLRDLSKLASLGRPILVGLSRKRMIGRATGRDAPRARAAGSLAAAVVAAQNGARIVRAHDVAAHVDAMRMVAALRGDRS